MEREEPIRDGQCCPVMVGALVTTRAEWDEAVLSPTYEMGPHGVVVEITDWEDLAGNDDVDTFLADMRPPHVVVRWPEIDEPESFSTRPIVNYDEEIDLEVRELIVVAIGLSKAELLRREYERKQYHERIWNEVGITAEDFEEPNPLGSKQMTQKKLDIYRMLASDSETKALLSVEAALSDAQRTKIIDWWNAVNPHLRGALVADILDLLYQQDSFLGVTEPFGESEDAKGEDNWTAVYGFACIAAVIVLGLQDARYESPTDVPKEFGQLVKQIIRTVETE